jgi:SWIM zinc finger
VAQAATLFRYSRPSALTASDFVHLQLQTWTPSQSTGVAPYFFTGFIERADLVAAGILAVAHVAASRYFEPMTKAKREAMNDPVVTADGERLRFESFSACCGVHARLDVDRNGLDGTFAGVGTTNVDVNPPLRAALARVLRGSPLRLNVGEDELVVETMGARIVEKKVHLPDRWIKGFAETQVAESRMIPRLKLSANEATQLVRSLPRGSREPVWIEPAGNSWRITRRPSSEHSVITGAERLQSVQPLLPYVTELTVFGPPDQGTTPASSTWEFTLDTARLSLTLSPEPSRGFSGEGGVLGSLIDDDDATGLAVDEAFATRPLWTVPQLASHVGAEPGHVRDTLDVLAASGRVGYDLHAGAFFQRVLPLGDRAIGVLNPRLRSAESLVGANAVTFDESGLRAIVVSADHHHVVNLVAATVTGARCTCPWYAKHRGERGPCKHVLAAVATARAQSI